MDAARWQKLAEIYDTLQNLEPDLRERYLDLACAVDPSLCNEIHVLLGSQEAADLFFEKPALDVVARAIAERGPVNLVV